MHVLMLIQTVYYLTQAETNHTMHMVQIFRLQDMLYIKRLLYMLYIKVEVAAGHSALSWCSFGNAFGWRA